MLRRPRHLVPAAPAGAAPPGPPFLPVAAPSATTAVAAGTVAGAPAAPSPRRARATPAAVAADVPGASDVGGVATSVVAPAPHPSAVPGPAVLTHRGLQLHVAAHRAVLDGAELHLTPSEFSLLAALLGSPRRVVSKAELSRHLWGEGVATSSALGDAERRTVEVHIANLRRKLSDDASDPRFIETVRGVGYRLAWRR
ncbi:winged helix-turn-helix domain-containing protein [Georgenia sp. AZ-5]|uniref:winged helix-turn-helix domain-containing protein n=1 Tax=Georgenia sp. AZ-5 TaxID=3367526 RepID=UPI00375404B2